MFALSYCFQISNNELCPDGIRIDGFEQIIQGMDQFRIAGTREAETVQRENVNGIFIRFLFHFFQIHLLLDIFSCLCFDDWQDSQLLCMLTALSRLYLDQQNVNIRHRITKAIRMVYFCIQIENISPLVACKTGRNKPRTSRWHFAEICIQASATSSRK